MGAFVRHILTLRWFARSRCRLCRSLNGRLCRKYSAVLSLQSLLHPSLSSQIQTILLGALTCASVPQAAAGRARLRASAPHCAPPPSPLSGLYTTDNETPKAPAVARCLSAYHLPLDLHLYRRCQRVVKSPARPTPTIMLCRCIQRRFPAFPLESSLPSLPHRAIAIGAP